MDFSAQATPHGRPGAPAAAGIDNTTIQLVPGPAAPAGATSVIRVVRPRTLSAQLT